MSKLRSDMSNIAAQEAVRRLLFPYLQPVEDLPHEHSYTLVLVQDDDCGAELATFTAPCPNGNKPGHVRVLVANLQKLIDGMASPGMCDGCGRVDQLVTATDDGRALACPNCLPAANTTCVDPEVLVNLLSLVGVTVSPSVVASWTASQQRQARKWAGATHLSASDNDVVVPERPAFLDASPGEGGSR